MKKTSIYIQPEVDRALGRRAVAEGTTKAALIRDALTRAAGEGERIRPQAAGVFHGPEDLAESADSYLDRTGFGGA